uniref:NADH dehydrogenase subunit 6 n=1 Tax=Cyanopterus ninghais TaxID=3079913 RepID=A0AA96TD83_9HYME|nr:NADH dehydrogenase subunit 6 [Cyanopterus ninghais]
MKNFDFLMIYVLMDLIMIMIMILPSNLYYFHPLTMGLLLILYVIIITFKMNFILNNYWYSYILFLVMVGGLMILFMYFTSLMNNELFYFKLKYNIFHMMKLMIYSFFFIYMILSNNYLNYILNMNYFEMKNFNYFFEFNSNNMYKNLMMDFSLSMNLYMIIYLFLMMVSVVIICNKTKIPLRQMSLI